MDICVIFITIFLIWLTLTLILYFNRTRLYRDGAELQPLMNDEAYDFNFQETRMLKEERKVHLVSMIIKFLLI